MEEKSNSLKSCKQGLNQLMWTNFINPVLHLEMKSFMEALNNPRVEDKVIMMMMIVD